MLVVHRGRSGPVTTVVDNYVDLLRQDEKVARRFSCLRGPPDARPARRARPRPPRGGRARRDDGAHRLRLRLLRDRARPQLPRRWVSTPSAIDVLALSHGHWDHWGGLAGMLRTYRRQDEARPHASTRGRTTSCARFTQRGADRVNMGRLHREEIERYDIQVESVRAPLMIADGVLLSGEMHEHEAFETHPREPAGGARRRDRAGRLPRRADHDHQRARPRSRGGHLLLASRHRGDLPPRRAHHRGAEGARGDRRLPPERAPGGARHPGGRRLPRPRGGLDRAPALHRARGDGSR